MKNGKKTFLLIVIFIVIAIAMTSCGSYGFLQKNLDKKVLKSQFAGEEFSARPNFFIETNCSLSKTNDYLNGETYASQDASNKIKEATIKGYGINFVQINVNLSYFIDKQVTVDYEGAEVEDQIKENSKDFADALDHLITHFDGIEYLPSGQRYLFNFLYKDIEEEKYVTNIVKSHIEFINQTLLFNQSGFIFAYKISYAINGSFKTKSKELKSKYNQIIDKQVSTLPKGKIAVIDDNVYDNVSFGGTKNILGKNFLDISDTNNIFLCRKGKKTFDENRWNVNFAEIAPKEYSKKEAFKILEALYQRSVSYINYTKSQGALKSFENIRINNDDLRSKNFIIYNNWFRVEDQILETRSMADMLKDFIGVHYVVSGVKIEKNANATSDNDYLKLSFTINNFGTAACFNMGGIYIFRGIEQSSYQLADNPPYREGVWVEELGAFRAQQFIYNIPKSSIATEGEFLGENEEIGIVLKEGNGKEVNLYNNTSKKRYPSLVSGESFNKVLIITEMLND